MITITRCKLPSQIINHSLQKHIQNSPNDLQEMVLQEILDETKYSRVDKENFVEDNLQKISREVVCFFKGYLPQNLLSPLLNTLSRMFDRVLNMPLHYTNIAA